MTDLTASAAISAPVMAAAAVSSTAGGIEAGVLAGAFAGAILFTLKQPVRPADTRRQALHEISLRLINFMLSWAIGCWTAESVGRLLQNILPGVPFSPAFCALLAGAGGMFAVDAILAMLRQKIASPKEPSP